MEVSRFILLGFSKGELMRSGRCWFGGFEVGYMEGLVFLGFWRELTR